MLWLSVFCILCCSSSVYGFVTRMLADHGKSSSLLSQLNNLDPRNSRPCKIHDCKPGYILDNVSCVCIPDLSNSQPSCRPCPTMNFAQDPKTCRCSCGILCFDTFDTIGVLDEDKCECIQEPCMTYITCPNGYQIDYENCPSICKNCSCIENQSDSSSPSLNSLSSASDVSSPSSCPSCQFGFTQVPDSCECICDLVCEDVFDWVGTLDDVRCECVYISPSSSITPTLPSSSDACFNPGCDRGFSFDSILCKCVILPSPSCPEGHFYDEDFCECVCNAHEECPENFEWNDHTCDCFCPKGEECPAGKVFDPNLCKCVCNEEISCSEGFYLNEDECRCSCMQEESCASGSTFDQDLCQCVSDNKPVCEHGFVFDNISCMCICESVAACRNLQVFDKQVCSCVCPKYIECLDGEILNSDSCLCENK